jgi:hypothetical protein
MSEPRPFELRAALLVVLAAASISCRNDRGADLHGADSNARSASTSSATPVTPPARSAEFPAAPSPVSPGSATTDAACGPPPPPGAPLPKLEKRALTAKKDGHYRFEFEYPLLRAPADKIEQKVNRLLFDRLAKIQTRFVREAENQGGESDPDNARWFEGKCEVVYDSPSFVSVGCETMEGPGAHPHVDKFAHSFQLCPDVKPLALADLCRALPECRKRIVALINEDFRTGDKKQTGIQFRAGPSSPGDPDDSEHPVANLQSFGITPGGLRFFLFDELPHVLQAFAVVDIPIAKLRTVLRDDATRAIWGS